MGIKEVNKKKTKKYKTKTSNWILSYIDIFFIEKLHDLLLLIF